jgi:D-arabinose 1-dehydrogenase-like Zn-dependent alcohol dehydrogenase
MSRAVIYETFGGPEVLEVQDVPEPHAGPGEVRVRVAAVGLNPMDPAIAATPELAARFNITVPAGFGYDFAGVVDEVSDGGGGFAEGDRVYGGVMERAAADFVVVKTPPAASEVLFHTPEGLSDELASTLGVAGATASAALAAIHLGPGDTVLIGGAAGGVGVFAVQLAQLAGATVIGTASQGTFPFLRELGAEPVTYGAGLADRVRALAADGITAAIDLFGTETVETALALGWHPSGSPPSPPARPLPAARARLGAATPSPARCPGSPTRSSPGRSRFRSRRGSQSSRSARPRRYRPTGTSTARSWSRSSRRTRDLSVSDLTVKRHWSFQR